MDEKQAADAARVGEVKARINTEEIQKRSLTGSAMQMVAQYAELGGAGLVTGAAIQTGRRLVDQAFDRPADPQPPQIEVEHGYRPKSGE